jgi:hypothetical protein
MFHKGEVIQHDQDLDYCIYLKKPIDVWQHGELLDYGGIISCYTQDSVKLDHGGYFLRMNCEFRIR